MDLSSERTELFIIVTPLGTRHPVLWWRDYGVVCPSLVTTNGAFRVIVAAMRPEYSIEAREMKPASTSPHSLWLAYAEWRYANGYPLPKEHPYARVTT